MGYGLRNDKSLIVRILSRLLAALQKKSPDGVSREVERGRVGPDPETKRLLGRGGAGRGRTLGGRDV